MFKKVPHTYVIIFTLIVLAAVATWFVPAGEFERQTTTTDSGKKVEQIVPGSFQRVEQSPQTWQITSAFFKGFQKAPGIIAFLLILGGAFWILNETKAIDMGVQTFLNKSSALEKYRIFKAIGVNNLIIICIMTMFSLFGALFGMSEETIAFVAIFVPLAVSMGYDSITGVCLCFLAAGLGFAGCVLNPFTLGIAQDIAGIKMFSGIEYRIVVWFIITFIGIAFVLWYANKVKRNPQSSIMYSEDEYWRRNKETAATLQALPASKTCKAAYFLALAIQIGFCVWTQSLMLIITTVLFAALGYYIYHDKQEEKSYAATIDEAKNSVLQIAVDSVYYVMNTPESSEIIDSYSYITEAGYSITGTAFITNDGRIVTARHCIEPWLNDPELTEKLPEEITATPTRWAILAETHNLPTESDTTCLLYTSPSPPDLSPSRIPSSA